MAKTSTKKATAAAATAPTHVKRGRPVTSSPTTSSTFNCRHPVGSTSHGSDGKLKHRPILPSTSRTPTVVIKRKSIDCNDAIRTFVSSRPKGYRDTSSIDLSNSSSVSSKSTNSSSRRSSNNGDKDELLKQLCLALSQATRQDRQKAATLTATNKDCDRRSSTSSISSTTSSSTGGQFGFLALGPLLSSRGTSTPATEVQEDDDEEEEEEEEEEKEEEEEEEEKVMVMGNEPTIEELETMIYSNTQDIKSEAFYPPLQLGEEDFFQLPIFDGMAGNQDRQQRQQPQQRMMPVAHHLTPSPSLSPQLSLSSLSSFSMMSADAINVWNAQFLPPPTPSSIYECYSGAAEAAAGQYTGNATATTTGGPYYLVQSFPPSPLPTSIPSSSPAASYFFPHGHNYAASQQTLLFQSMNPQVEVPAAGSESVPLYIQAAAPVPSCSMAHGSVHPFSSPSPLYMQPEFSYLRPYPVQLQAASVSASDASAWKGSSPSYGSCVMNQQQQQQTHGTNQNFLQIW